MPPAVDKALIRARFGASLPHYDGEAEVQRGMARALVSLLHGIERTEFSRALEIGCGSGLLTGEIARRLQVGMLFANDLDEECGATFGEGCGAACCELRFIPGDIERLDPLPGELDLVASNAVFHWLAEPEALLERLAPALVEGGLLVIGTFGPENLLEVGEVSGARLAYRTMGEMHEALARNFRVRHVSEGRVRLRFESPRRVLEHLRRTGANSLRRTGWTSGALRAFEAEYRSRFPLPCGGVSLTYHPLLLVAER